MTLRTSAFDAQAGHWHLDHIADAQFACLRRPQARVERTPRGVGSGPYVPSSRSRACGRRDCPSARYRAASTTRWEVGEAAFYAASMGFEVVPGEDSEARVEEILDAAVARNPGSVKKPGANPVATHAAWFCACIYGNHTWLIDKTPDDGIFWQRVKGRKRPRDLVQAQRFAGGHVDPDEVLNWVQGMDNPWGFASDVSGDPTVLPELARWIRSE